MQLSRKIARIGSGSWSWTARQGSAQGWLSGPFSIGMKSSLGSKSKPTSLQGVARKTLLSARFCLLASRIELAQSLRVRRNTFSVSMDYTFARSASHCTGRRFQSGIDLFTDHSFSLESGAVATPHQFHHPQRHNAICLGCQHHQRSEHPRVGPARFEKGNSVHLTATFCPVRNWNWAEAGRPAPQRANRSRHRKRGAALLVRGMRERPEMLESRPSIVAVNPAPAKTGFMGSLRCGAAPLARPRAGSFIYSCGGLHGSARGQQPTAWLIVARPFARPSERMRHSVGPEYWHK